MLPSFQSTHSRGVRQVFALIAKATESFNPRTHEECDQQLPAPVPAWPVSIHALTRSATGQRWQFTGNLRVSIHALTRSATLRATRTTDSRLLFQSTHSRGVRQTSLSISSPIPEFQSTHSRGVRHSSSVSPSCC